MDPQTTQPQLDQSAVLLAKAIRQTESGGNANARGKSGEFGAYQFTPSTWQKYAADAGVNVPLEKSTLEDQNKVAYSKIKQWKDQGYNVGQVASMWNSGTPDNYANDHRGVNAYGVAYDTPRYAKSVASAYQTLKTGGQVGVDPNNPSSTVGAQQVQDRSSGVRPDDGYSVGGFLGNVLKSGAGVVGGIGNALLHPVQTVTNLGNAAQGAVELLIPGQQGHEEQAKAIGKFFADRYGGFDKIKNSLYNDPVGVMLDLSTLIDGGGAAFGSGSKLAGLAGATDVAGNLSKAADVARVAGEATDPLRYAAKAAGRALGFGSKVGSDVVGNLSSLGGEAVRDIYSAGREGGGALQDLTSAMRGTSSPEQVLSTVRDAVGDVVKTERKAYQTALAGIKDAEHTLTPEALSQIKSTFEDQLKQLDVVRDAKGIINPEESFSGSILDTDSVAKRRILQLEEKIDYAIKHPTPGAVDNLKRFAGDAYQRENPLNAITQPVHDTTRKVLNENVPAYQEMTSRYHQYKDFKKELDAAVGGDKATKEMALRKVRSVFRDTQHERLSMVDKLENKTGKNIRAPVAGMLANPLMPGGLAKHMQTFGGIEAAIHPGAIPALLPGLLASSPRVVGEVARALGVTTSKLESLIAVLEKSSGLTREQILKLLAQGGRISAGGQGSRSPSGK